MQLLVIFITIIVNFILQSTVVPYFQILGKVPNISLVLVVIYSLARGKYYGGIIGLIIGLIQDILFSVSIGLNAIIYFFIGYLIGNVEDAFARDNIISPLVLTIVATIFYNAVYSTMVYFLGWDTSLEIAARSIFSFEIVYNAIISVFVYKLIKKIFSQPRIRFYKR